MDHVEPCFNGARLIYYMQYLIQFIYFFNTIYHLYIHVFIYDS